MAAPRKDNERARLYAAAQTLFVQKGYTGTSYRDIAEACNTSRSVVQHYYPRKEMLLTLFLESHFNWLRERAQELCPPNSGALEYLCMIGLIHFDKLLKDGEESPLIEDILARRPVMERLIEQERDWIIQRCGPNINREYVGSCIVASLGGAYSLASINSRQERPLTADGILRIAFMPFAISVGVEPGCIEGIISECRSWQMTC